MKESGEESDSVFIFKGYVPLSCSLDCLPHLFGMNETQKENKNSGKGKEKHVETGRGRSSRGRRWCGRCPTCSSRCTCSLRCPPSMVSRTGKDRTKSRKRVFGDFWLWDEFTCSIRCLPFVVSTTERILTKEGKDNRDHK